MSVRWQKTALQLKVAGACLLLVACSAKPKGDADPPSRFLVSTAAGSGSGTGTAGKGGAGAVKMRSADRCVEGNANASRVAPRVILLLDGSCSMSTDYPADGAESASECVSNPRGRWAALHNALLDPMTGVVPKLQSLVQFGLVVFGTSGTCPIPAGHTPVKPALNNLAAVSSSMPAVQPGQFTPTGPALNWVYENMIDEYTPDSNNGPQIVILATDGEPNSCDGGGGGGRRGGGANYQPSIDAVKNGTSKGVTTYIISLADAAGSFHDHLQQLADLGDPGAAGHAMLYAPSSPAELSQALQTLVGGAVGCDIVLDGSLMPGTECQGIVQVNGTKVACNDPNGYKVTDPRHIRLQGKSCELLMDTTALVEARFPCSSLSPD
jgi:von Willebrand factor type A domain